MGHFNLKASRSRPETMNGLFMFCWRVNGHKQLDSTLWWERRVLVVSEWSNEYPSGGKLNIFTLHRFLYRVGLTE